MDTPTDRQRGARYALGVLMWVISEWNWTVHWEIDLEYALWRAVVEGTPIADYPVVGDEAAAALRLLAEEAGGWFSMPGGAEAEPQFCPLDEWLTLYERWWQQTTGGGNDAPAGPESG